MWNKNFIFTIFCLLFLLSNIKAQFPQPLPQGNTLQEWYQRGAVGSATGYHFLTNYSDTAAANSASYISGIPNFLIVVNGVLYKRNAAATKWETSTAGSGWLLAGNAGTNPSTDFIGTTDSVDLIAKANNKERLRLGDSAWRIGNNLAYVKSSTVGNKLHIYTSQTTVDTVNNKPIVGKLSDGEVSYMSSWPGLFGSGTIYNIPKWTSSTALGNSSYVMDLNQVPQSGLVINGDSAIFFGDSYTEGIGATTTAQRWTTLLCGYLGATEDNRGVSGTTLEKRVPVDPLGTPNMIDNLPTVPVKTFKKKLLVIAYGLNDFGYNGVNYNPTNYKTDYDSILTYITQTKGWPIKNILIIPPYWIGSAGYAAYAAATGNGVPTRANQLLFVEAAHQTALKWGTLYVDIYNDILRNDTTLIKGTSPIHANDSGYLFIAKDIAKYLGAQLPQPLPSNLVTGTGTSGQMAYMAGTSTLTSSANNTFNGTTQSIAGSTSTSTFRVGSVEHQAYGVNNCWIGENVYFNGGQFVSRAAGSGTLFYFNGEEGQFRTFPSVGAATDVTSYMSNAQFKVGYTNRTVAIGGDISQTPGSLTGATLVSNSNGVSIGSAAVPAASAILDVTSTTKGALFPRMTTTQKNAISSPAIGLIVYDTTLNKLCVYTGAWETITSLSFGWIFILVLLPTLLFRRKQFYNSINKAA